LEKYVVLYFPTFQLTVQGASENRNKWNRSGNSCASVDHTGLVAISSTSDQRTMLHPSISAKNTSSTSQTREKTPLNKDEISCFSIIRESLESRGIPAAAADIIIKSWRKTTKKQYNCYIKQWIRFCGKKRNPLKPSVNTILAFFVTLYKKGLKYSVFQTARAAINNFVSLCSDLDFSSNKLINKFMHGIY
jgi:hypothetical protein